MQTNNFSIEVSWEVVAGTPVSDEALAAFRASLSNPTALRTEVTYAQAAQLVQDGLSEGTDPFFLMPVPR